VLDWLSHAEGTATLDDLRHRLTRYQPVGIDPEELWELGNELSYEVVFSCAHATASSGYDIVFRRRASDALESPMPLWPFRLETDPATPWQCYTNAPRQASATQQLVPYLRQQLRAKLPAYMIPSSLVILDTLPMSPNGKVDRQALSERDILRPPTTAAFVEPRTDPEIALARIWTDVLGLSRVGIHDNFFELGGDSILSIQIVAKANRAGLRLMPRLLFQYQTIAELAAAANVEVKGVPALEAAQQGLITGAVPLTPIQHWFFAQNIAEPQQWNQSRLLAVPPPLDIALLKRAVHQVLSHHDLLRARFRCSPSGWYQDIVPSEPNRVCEDVDLSALPAGQQNMMMQACFEQLQASLDLALGPLVRMVVFDLGPQRYARLFIVVHHLVIDGVSWPILLDDLQTAYDHLHSGREVRLPMKTTSFQYWAARLSLYAQADALRDELPYWAALPQERFRALPRDHAHGDNTVASAHMVSASLSREETYALLHEVPKAYQTQINDALLTALTQVFVRWTGLPALWFDLEGHGREDIFDGVDVSRTVGWFTSLFPVCLQMEPTVDTGEALKGVKEQLRCIPHRGIGYGVLRYLCQHIGAMDNLRTLPQSEINFNYLGRIDQAVSIWFNLIDVPCGHPRNPRSQRPYVLEINSYLTHGRLHLDWTYSQALHQPATIEALAHDFMEALRTLITHCSAPETGGYTPSDFPHLAVNQDELDTLLQSLDASEEGD
jgi:non-ribosomal peptide synthase protein (TIGR01720 family)